MRQQGKLREGVRDVRLDDAPRGAPPVLPVRSEQMRSRGTQRAHHGETLLLQTGMLVDVSHESKQIAKGGLVPRAVPVPARRRRAKRAASLATFSTRPVPLRRRRLFRRLPRLVLRALQLLRARRGVRSLDVVLGDAIEELGDDEVLPPGEARGERANARALALHPGILSLRSPTTLSSLTVQSRLHRGRDEIHLLLRRERARSRAVQRNQLLVVHGTNLLHRALRRPKHRVRQNLRRGGSIRRVGLEHVVEYLSRGGDGVPREFARLERAERKVSADDALVLVQTLQARLASSSSSSSAAAAALAAFAVAARGYVFVPVRGRRPGEHGEDEVSERPHVHRGGERESLKHLRRSPLKLHVDAVPREGGHRVLIVLPAVSVLQAHAETEIREFELAARRAQAVIRFDVIVRDSRRVHVGDGGGERLDGAQSIAGGQIRHASSRRVSQPLREGLAAPLHRREHRVRAVHVRPEEERDAVRILVQVSMQRNLAFHQRADALSALAGRQRDALDGRGATHHGR